MQVLEKMEDPDCKNGDVFIGGNLGARGGSGIENGKNPGTVERQSLVVGQTGSERSAVPRDDESEEPCDVSQHDYMTKSADHTGAGSENMEKSQSFLKQ